MALLWELGKGQPQTARALALAVGAHVRTVQRDLNERLDFLHLRQPDGRYRLAPGELGRFTAQDLRVLADRMGLPGAWPGWDEHLLKRLTADEAPSFWRVRGPVVTEPADGLEALFEPLSEAIRAHQRVGFRYQRPQRAACTHDEVEPIQLLHQKGIWYLLARDRGKTKTFALARMAGLLVSDQTFTPRPDEPSLADEDPGIWVSDQPQRVTVRVAPAVAHYFQRKALLPLQRVLACGADGGLLLEAQVGHPLQVLPVVRHWIPHLRIESPADWQRTLEAGLRDYLGD